MSTKSCDVSQIQDEDVLRKMWQETEDFGRKKEIRAHMYKVREARLKNLYSSSTETQVQKSMNEKTTHADSLADHSFLSLKSKEVRDSESPTRDVAFINKINAADKYGNTGWTITSSDDTSEDGKTHTAVRLATTSGTEKIDKGISSYAAKAEQKSSVYQDGDADNFTRSVDISDGNTVHQEASGGDAFSSFKSSATTTKSSSKTCTESQSKSGDVVDYSIPKKIIPADVKTIVYKETKNLPDGSKITTTRYETRGGSCKSETTRSNVQKSSTTNQQSSIEQRSDSQHVTTNTSGKQLKSSDHGVDTVDYKQVLKLSEDLAKNINISDSGSKTKSLQQDSAETQHDQSSTIKLYEVKSSGQIEPSPEELHKEPESYSQPERRQLVKPSKSELEVASKATEGQYDTTYRSEFTNKKIHVEVSPTHDAFVRSLRALTPEDLKSSGNRSVRNSNTSLRSSQSPEKMRHPSRVSPDRLYSAKSQKSPEKSYEPRKKCSPDKVSTYSSDAITEKHFFTDDSTVRLTEDIDGKDRTESRSRSVSPKTIFSDFELVSNLKKEDKIITSTTTVGKTINEIGDTRPSTLNYSKRSKKITERSPTSPLTDLLVSKRTPSPTKEATINIRRTSLKEQQQQRQEKILRRTDTYEERCRQILGIPEKKKPERNVSDIINTDSRTYKTSSMDQTTKEVTIRKPCLPDAARHPSKSPEKCAVNGYPDKKSSRPQVSEFPSQIRRSPERKSLDRFPERQSSPNKDKSTISEFPSQIRRSPQKLPLEKYPERKSPKKESPKISEFPAQIRRSPEKEPSPTYPEKESVAKEGPTIRKSPEKQSSIKEFINHEIIQITEEESLHKISEFPSQIRRSPEKESLPEYPEKKVLTEEALKISEFPSQIRITPDREPTQIRQSVERELVEKTLEQKSPSKITEFPAQIRKTPEREPLPEYPEKKATSKQAPTISEFPSQIRRTPEKEPLPQYPEKQKEAKEPSKLSEFPSQIRHSPTKHVSELPTETPKPTSEDIILQETTDYLYKDKIPINEPMFTKKFIAELGSDDECEITVDEHGNTKINTIDDEEFYIQEIENVSHKSVKKDSPERQFIREKLSQERDQTIKQQIDEFISTERNDIYRTTESRKSSPDLRRSPERGILKHTSQFDEKTDDKIKTQIVEIKVETMKSKQKTPVITKKDSCDTKINITSSKVTKEVKEIPDTKPKQTTSSNKSAPLRKIDTSTSKKAHCDSTLETTSIDSKICKKLFQKQPEPTTTPKRHVVTATINVSPKVTTTRAIKNITNTQTVPTKPSLSVNSARTKKINVENIENQDKITQKKKIDKLIRTNNEQTPKTQVTSKPNLTADKHKKCITTKTILINNTVADEREIIVDLLRSTSTREDRNTVCPIPVKNNDGKGSLRYPDQVTEPDDVSVKHTPRKLTSMPIDEYEDVSDFIGVSEVTTEDVIKEETTEEMVDESLLSVNEKVSKYASQRNKAKGPAQKVERPILIIDEKLESDECLLSVSEKVNKFVNKADKLLVPDGIERPKSPRCQNIIDITVIDENDESLMSVSDKVTHFVTTAENVKKPQTSTMKVEKTDLSTVDESLRTDECLLSVSDKVTKFITTAENLTTHKDAITPKKPVTLTQKQPDIKQTDIKNSTPKNADRTSPTRRTSIKEERRISRKDSSSTLTRKDSSSATTDIETTPKTSRPLRSAESIRKAKALFEKMATGTENRELKRQKDILNRTSIFGAKTKVETITRRLTPDRDDIKLKDIGIKESTDIRRKLSFPSDDECKTTADYKSTKTLLEKARASELDDLNETKDHPDNLDVPGYMKPLDRSLRPNSPHRSSVSDIEEIVSKTTTIQETVLPEVPTAASKFGVTLRRIESGKKTIGSITATTERKKSLINSILKNNEIEEIYELDILEELLETTVGYDLRRRIRAQIRLVKNLISEDKLKIVNIKSTSPSREVPEFTKKLRSPTRQMPANNQKSSDANFTEYQTKYIRKSSADSKLINNHLYEHTNLDDSKDKTEYQNNYSKKSSTTKDTVVKSRETSPEIKPSRREKSPSEKSKYFQTDLKKVCRVTKSTKEDKPEWITNRILQKRTDTPSPVAKKYSSSTTKTTLTKEIKSSDARDGKPTDVITSSYGVGPIDENGSPLFGLKALRTQNKVQGTVVRSQFYSENGQEPVGEISVTKYSTDQADLGSDGDITREDGLLSKTTTQKFGHKGTPSYKSIIDGKFSEIENDNRTNKSTTKVTRRGSVKEITQKFLENTVDSLKSEKQAYPKAGLILRTSFKEKNERCKMDGDGSPTEVSIIRTSSTKTTSAGQPQKGQTFLTNTSKVTGLQDIVSRMQESNKEIREGDSVEDTEARSLLNKFLGGQVLLSGIEGGDTKKSSTSTTKISTTITEGGKTRTVIRTFTHPIAAEDLAAICDEETLRLLLEQSSDYDERRNLRARIKEVMAAKEVCATSIETDTNSSSTTNMSTSDSNATAGSSLQQQQGESLLLPLLQGLLDVPDLPKSIDNSVEAGADLRTGLIIEVQSALDKLTACLCSDATDITAERRESLLQLVYKLQANLVTSSGSDNSLGQAGRDSERRASRFNKRKQRQNRHTVGVTSEELEDARRLMEEFALKDMIPLRKQNSESAVQRNCQGSAFRPVKFQPYIPLHIKNTTAKPFNSSNHSSISHTPSGASSTVNTPTEPSESLDLLFTDTLAIKSPPHQLVEDTNKYIYKQSISLDHNDEHHHKKPLQQTMSLDNSNLKDVDLMSIHQAVQQAAATKQQLDRLGVDLEIDEDAVKLNTVDLFHHTIINLEEYNQQPDLLLQSNPLFVKRNDSIDRESRFNSKKMKMKRANTIDIPKPMKCYVDENESEDDDRLDRRHSSYIQLRGPLNVGKFNNKKAIPTFEAKTESDKKFMAFINRQNQEKVANSMVKTSIWDNHQIESSSNWNRKFGNIKTNFERNSFVESNISLPVSRNTARNFWKTADDAHSAGVITYNGPKISKQSARNLQQMFEEKQKQSQSAPWAGNIVKGSLTVDAKVFENSKNKFTPQTSVNMFSHAPMSAFKPIQKNQINVAPDTTRNQKQLAWNNHQQNTPDIPLFLYSPKPFNNRDGNSCSVITAETSLRVKQTPWSLNNNESRVRNIAVAKFEGTPESPIVSTRKKSTEKVSLPKYLQQNVDRAPTNYVSFSSAAIHQNKQSGSVQKISGKYNVLPEPVPTPRHQSAFATVPQSNPKFPQNYQQLPYTHSITYSQPKVPYNNQFYHQIDDLSANRPKLDQMPQENKYQKQQMVPQKHDSHIVYNNVHQTEHQSTNYINQEQRYLKNTPISPYQNGHQFDNTNHHLPAAEASFVSSVSPPKMHHNELYRNTDDSLIKEKYFSPPESPCSRVPKYEHQESIHEYNAVSSRVMTGPISQQAVNVNQKAPKSRNQHDMDAAFSLKSTLQKIDKIRLDKSPTPPKKQCSATMPNVMVNDKPLESLVETNERGESIVTSKFHIPVKTKPEVLRAHQGQALSKCDSWQKICQSGNLAMSNKPPNVRAVSSTVSKSKSTHTLGLPKQFEAGMSRDEMAQKKHTMEAYFVDAKSPKLSGGISNKASAINRTKTSDKVRQMSNSGGLSRSRTLPDIVCADLLDESNVDEAFEDLFKAKCYESTKQPFTESTITTTQVSPTKVMSQQQVSMKPMSPFAKFKQLDRANSLNTPPSTPKTPIGGGGGGPMFKFTDPQLSRSASTIKERLLQWCQMKTKEYENIQLDNFSGSWADGLAFCALIHHFLPDTFDYTKLTANNRRYNFTLAFQIADEKADIAPLLDVDDMVATRRPDWKCVFTYVQSIYRRFKDED